MKLGRRARYSGVVINIVFDTGVLWHPTKLRQLSMRPDVAIWPSTINVFETLSDVIDERTFKRVKGQMSLLLEVGGNRFLPNTDTQFRLDLGYPGVMDDPYEWRHIAVLLARCRNLKEADERIDFGRAVEMRRAHADKWVLDLVEQTIKSINPGLTTAPDWNVRVTADEVAKFRAWLESPAGEREQLKAWFRRQRWYPTAVPENVYKQSRPILQMYMRAYAGYVLHIVEYGRKPEPNDALDLDQVFPLWRDNWIFVSADLRLLKCLELGRIERHRFRAIQDLDPAEDLEAAFGFRSA